MNKLKGLERWISTYFAIFRKDVSNVQIEQHNGQTIYAYPENEWFLVPFPKQKGKLYNSDNLATVNRHEFINNEKFKLALHKAEERWKENNTSQVRDISWRLHTMLWSLSNALRNIENESTIFVECGTGKGYMAAAICEYFKWDADKPKLYLIDSFRSTMPNKDGVQKEDGSKLFVYADGDSEVRQYFSNYNHVEIITGFIPGILEKLPENATIGFLHMDLNNAIAEKEALAYLKPRFKKGTIILFDDYGGYGGNTQAEVHEDFAKKEGMELLVLPTGQALLIF